MFVQITVIFAFFCGFHLIKTRIYIKYFIKITRRQQRRRLSYKTIIIKWIKRFYSKSCVINLVLYTCSSINSEKKKKSHKIIFFLFIYFSLFFASVTFRVWYFRMTFYFVIVTGQLLCLYHSIESFTQLILMAMTYRIWKLSRIFHRWHWMTVIHAIETIWALRLHSFSWNIW